MEEFFTSKPFLWPAIFFFFVHGIISIFRFTKKDERGNPIWWFHQFFFNGAGAFIGWVALYYFFQSNICKIGIQHFIALLIGFLGITGYLPFAVMSLLKSDIVKKIREIPQTNKK